MSFKSKFLMCLSTSIATLLCSCSSIADNYQIDYDKSQDKIETKSLYEQDGPLLQEDTHINLFLNSAKNTTINLQNNSTIVQSQNSKVELITLKPIVANQVQNIKTNPIIINDTNDTSKTNIYKINYKLDSRSVLNKPSNPGYYFPRINNSIDNNSAPRQAY